MNPETLYLVRLAQALCDRGYTPSNAVKHLRGHAANLPDLSPLLDADASQAIAELDRRFSGHPVKPWEVDA